VAGRTLSAQSATIELTPDSDTGAGDFAMEEFTAVEQVAAINTRWREV